MKNRVVIIGASGHARVIASIFRLSSEYDHIGYIDQQFKKGHIVGGLPVLGGDEELADIINQNDIDSFIVGIGCNFLREQIAQEITSIFPKLDMVSAIHPQTCIAEGFCLGKGSVVMPYSVLGVDVKAGKGCIFNTGSLVDHDTHLGNYSSIGPGGTLGGSCSIGDRTFIGLGANIIQGITIGRDTVVGAGSLVIHSFGSNKLVYGSPARVIKNRAKKDKYL